MLNKAFIFDTETTGLTENRILQMDRQPWVIEFYGHIINLPRPKDITRYKSIDTLFKPQVSIKPETTLITGIDNSMVQEAPTFADCALYIKKMIESCSCVIGHNVSFDIEMIDIEMERCSAPKVKWPPRICTVEQTVHLKGFRLSLGALHLELFGEGFADAHMARTDVLALTRCCVELTKRGML